MSSTDFAQPIPLNKIAVSMVKRGVPVIPVRAHDKIPLPMAWQFKASKNPNDILGWINRYPTLFRMYSFPALFAIFFS